MSWSVSMPSCFVAKSENPLMIGNQSIYRDKKVEAFREGEDLVLMFTQPHVLRIPIQDRQAIDDEVVHMLKMRTEEGGKNQRLPQSFWIDSQRSLLKIPSCLRIRSKSVCRKKGYVKKYRIPVSTVP